MQGEASRPSLGQGGRGRSKEEGNICLARSPAGWMSHTGVCAFRLWAPFFPKDQAMKHDECSLLQALDGKGMRFEALVMPRQPSPSTETISLPCPGEEEITPPEAALTG